MKSSFLKLSTIIFLDALLAASAQLFLKLAVNDISLDISLQEIFFIIVQSPFIYIGILLYILSIFLWLIILSLEDLGLVFPLLSIGFLIGLFYSWIILDENISILRVFGTIIICVGIAVVMREKKIE